MTTIAFLGTGLMGTGFIQRARANDLTVRAWNRSAAKAQALAANDAAGVTACATVGEAVRGAERIYLSLADDASVDDEGIKRGEGQLDVAAGVRVPKP